MTSMPACGVAQTSATEGRPPISGQQSGSLAQAPDYFPLRKGSYWLYEVRGSSGTGTGYKQVLVTDEVRSSEVQGATDFVVSIIDHTIRREDRPDEPTTM